jgi:GNAT superfamily N-acetyltransferase
MTRTKAPEPTITPLDDPTAPGLDALLAADPAPLYYYVPGVDPAGALAVARERLGRRLASEDRVGAWQAGIPEDGSEASRLVGLLVAGRRRWESEHLGLAAGAIEHLVVAPDLPRQARERVFARLLEAAEGAFRDASIVHVTCRTDTTRVAQVQALEAAGYATMDVVLHHLLSRGARRPAPEASPGVRIRGHAPGDATRVAEIARRVYRYDRLHVDPALETARVADAYAAWGANSCRGLADHVVVAEVDGVVAGFFTLRVDPDQARLGVRLAKVWLVGLDEAFQGRGLGPRLMAAAEAWAFDEAEADVIEVGTQLANHPALRLYGRRGFLPANSVFAHRLWLGA